MNATVRINMWSSPRNLSTAMMYAWRQRADTTVVDEPLYAHYLRVTGRDHPGRDEVLAAMESEGAAVLRDVYGEVDAQGIATAPCASCAYPTPVADLDGSRCPDCAPGARA